MCVLFQSEDPHLTIVCALLGISKPEISRWLTHRRIASAHEVILSRMDVQKAAFARDALAKRMYGELFAWLVHGVNRALDTGCAKKHFIGMHFVHYFGCILNTGGAKNYFIDVFLLKFDLT